MWLLFARAPPPDARPWPGRRLMAAIDAVAWPAAWVVAVAWFPGRAGAVGQLVAAVAFAAAVSRLHRALLVNHRYQFTAWTWGKRVGWLLLVGFALKVYTNLLSR